MKTEIIKVTPTIAQMYLERNDKNRGVSRFRIKTYADLMVKGEWELNGQAIIISKEGDLLDGQHRLHAVIESGVDTKMLFIFGVDAKTMHSLDRGKNRTTYDLLTMNKKTNCAAMASAMPMILSYRRCGLPVSTATKVSVAEAEELMEDERLQDATKIGTIKQLRTISTPAVLTFCAYVFYKHNQQKAEEFFEILKTGITNHQTEHCIILARDMLMSGRNSVGSKKGVTTTFCCAVLFKAFRAYCNRWTIKHMKVIAGGELEKGVFDLHQKRGQRPR